LEFRILGALEVLDETGAIRPLGGAKQRATLAMLLLHGNEVVSKERLIDGLWGSSPPPSAEATVKTYVSRLRQVLPGDERGPRLTTRPPGYRLRVEPGELDLERFETRVAQGRAALASDPTTARDHLREGLALFRGTPLEDLAHVPFAQGEVGRLEEERLRAIELRIEADLATGHHADVVGELESLVARHPFREALWSQLMVALYRSGRGAEALNAFDRARRILVEELGVNPGQPLRDLQRRMLQQDPSLVPAIAAPAPPPLTRPRLSVPSGSPAFLDRATHVPDPARSTAPPDAPSGADRPRRPRFPPGRRTAVAAALALVAAAGGVLVPRLLGDDGDVRTTTGYRPGVVLIDLSSGQQITDIPRGDLAQAAYPVFAGGHFWVNDWNPSGYLEIDPGTGDIVNQFNPPARDPNVHDDFETITPFTVSGDAMWVTSADDLVKVDTPLGKEADRVRLDDLGHGSGVAEGIAFGAGSVWISRDVGRGQLLRLDPSTHRVQHVWDDLTPYVNLRYGDGSLWVGDESGLLRIDPATNAITRVTGVAGICSGGVGGCVEAGAGFGWASDRTKGVVYKVNPAGQIASTYDVGFGAGFLSYADGLLWVSNGDDGIVTGFDPTTDTKSAKYEFGHPIETMSAGAGVLLTSILPGAPVTGRINALTGTVAKFFAHDLGLGDEEPALNTDLASYQIEFATCAKLLNYPDAPPPRGLRLRPEIAATMPTVSSDRRTYTFTIRPGYRFSPPSNQVVTAETFRYSIERALSPHLAEGPTVPDPPGPRAIDDIEGEQAFRRGTAQHISGLRARGRRLSITLVMPSADFLERLALPFFCPVPIGTAFVAGAPHQVNSAGEGYIVSAGPYYVAAYATGYAILERNPNYRGPRSHGPDAIVIRDGVDASAALDQVQHAGWGGISNVSDSAFAPGAVVDQRWGQSSAAAAEGDQAYYLTPQVATRYIAFNPGRGIFTDPRIRHAAALTLDRSALAAAWSIVPTDQLLSPALRGHRGRRLYPLELSPAKARRIMDGRTGEAVMGTQAGCGPCASAAELVRTELDTIGIHVRIREVDDVSRALESGAAFDLLDMETRSLIPDPASFLEEMLRDLPPSWVPSTIQGQTRRVGTLTGSGRQHSAAALADRLVAQTAIIAAYGIPHTSQIVGPRWGCRVFTPPGYGLDLAALCPQQLP
jgi:DNA-binding SARP family transcriptional activator/ABC-type transport system substrate-binding protein